MNKDPDTRIGIKSKEEIKNHRFFYGVDWQKVLNQEYAAPQIELEEENYNGDKGIVIKLGFLVYFFILESVH